MKVAGELAADVRALGAELLSVLEKRDAEALSRLRAGHELSVLTSAPSTTGLAGPITNVYRDAYQLALGAARRPPRGARVRVRIGWRRPVHRGRLLG
jgi:hypothetical protein